MRPSLPIGFLAFLSILWTGCKSSETVERPDQPVLETHPDPIQFVSTSDTVRADSRPDPVQTSNAQVDDEIRYMVQIGAFKDPINASRVQALARERFRVPVVNDYQPFLKLYQTRIGFFRTEEEADKFRQRMQREFPKDYRDAWIVQLLR
jgi:cell division protein FtsN